MNFMIPVLLIGLLLPTVTTSGSQGTETKHVVLIHGAYHGGWCWYKVSSLLQREGYTVAALDLTSLGINKAIADDVTSLAQYVQPAVEYLEKATDRVVVVAHSLGGAGLSYLMEQFGAEKIAKAVFLASIMPQDNQSFLQASLAAFKQCRWASDEESNLNLRDISPFPSDSMQLHFANGPSNPPTSTSFNLSYGPQLIYNKSPLEDITLSNSLLVPQPYSVSNETLHLTPGRHGRIPRYSIVTVEDKILHASVQELNIAQNPPVRVFRLNESDHSAFFSQPLALAKVIRLIDSL